MEFNNDDSYINLSVNDKTKELIVYASLSYDGGYGVTKDTIRMHKEQAIIELKKLLKQLEG
jgi:hypothetical protein